MKIKTQFLILLIIPPLGYVNAQSLETSWTRQVTPENAHREYPRPQMIRDDWMNLNGHWDYSIQTVYAPRPDTWQGKILVPFPVESTLSGVTKALSPEQALWYERTFKIPAAWKGRRVLLHFEAVDWLARVWVNGHYLGEHQGGYDAFSFDITGALSGTDQQSITISVWDPTDKGFQPVGKQTLNPRGIWYTSTSGIWQTVWLEAVPSVFIESLRMTPDPDQGRLYLKATGSTPAPGYEVEAVAFDHGNRVASVRGPLDAILSMSITNVRRWSPYDPFLYDLEISLYESKRKVDGVKSYFGMREVSIRKDEEGIMRIFLNGHPLFQFGTLDQGFWPDGIYTAPTEEAMKFDIQVTKDLGFNMIRKHVKVEPKTWYTWCDRLGLLVWQDMPSGDHHIRPDEPDIQRTAQSAHDYYSELKELVDEHYNHPSVVTWVPFNEGWGQFGTQEVAHFIRDLDSTRLVNATTGWADRGVGDMHDIHSYPGPDIPQLEDRRAAVLGEFGGQAYVDRDHLWITDFSKAPSHYKTSPSREELVVKYDELIMRLIPLKDKGLAAAVYTQTTDVESEVNGLMTYDRKVIKFDKEHMRKLHTPLYETGN